MSNIKHTGFYLSNTVDKTKIIKHITDNSYIELGIDFKNLNGYIHSKITIDNFIKEELLHDNYIINTIENCGLHTMSSGQKKSALLNYIILQQPAYIILDDVYSNIDKSTQEYIKLKLKEISSSTTIIQLFYRKSDLLEFIDQIYTIHVENKIISLLSKTDFFQSAIIEESNHINNLPDYFQKRKSEINPIIQLKSVSAHYGSKHVLENINWTINSGEFWQLKGPNGSGKSTLLTMITGDNPRAYGQDMLLFGMKKGQGESIWDIKQQIGYFTPSMLEQFTKNDTVENMIISGMNDSIGLYKKPTDLQKDIAKNWITMLGESFFNSSFQHLSLGQQRMVMVARAMVKHPLLLILDEPTIELDDKNSQLFVEMVNAIASEKKVSIIYVSHREEKHLRPEKIFELVPGMKGFTGNII